MAFRHRPAAPLGTWLTRLLRRGGMRGTRPDLTDWLQLIEPSRVTRIVVLKAHDQLGDFMVATPALAALRARFPRTRITLVTRPFLADLARAQPDVDEVLVVPRISGPRGVGALLRLIAALTRPRPEIALVLNSVSRSRTVDALAAVARPLLVIGRSRVGDGPLPADLPSDPLVFKGHLIPGWPVPDGVYDIDVETMATSEHQSARIMDLMTAVGASGPWRAMRLAIGPAARAEGGAALERVWAAAVPGGSEASASTHGSDGPARWIGIHPGAANPLKCWPLERFVELGAALVSRAAPGGECRLVVFDSPREAGRARAVRDGLLARGVPAGLVPAGPIGGFAAIATHLSLLVCNDSGVMHIAAALGVPTVSFHSLGRPEEWTPAHGRAAAFYADHAIETLPVAPALAAAERLLAGAPLSVGV